MKKPTDAKDTNILILGLGQYPKGSGVSATLFFAAQGYPVRVTDQKTAEQLQGNVEQLRRYPNVEFVLGKHRLQDIRWADVIVRNPRVRPSSPEMKLATKLGKRVESDVSLFMARCPCPIVAVTGTRGKSTTATLTAEMLKASGKRVWLGGNLLVSPLTFLSKVKKTDIVVLELSSWLLETTGALGLAPRYALVTNLKRDHLNTYGSMDEYAEAKAQIFRHQHPNDVVILNADDAYGQVWIKEAPGKVLTFSSLKKTTDGWLNKTALWWKDSRTNKPVEILSRSQLQVLGEHNALNILAAALLARSVGASLKGIREAARSFSGIADRLELLRTWKGIQFVNDTTASTPDATIAALRAFVSSSSTIHLLAGGADKELLFDELAQEMKGKKMCVSLFEGTALKPFSAALKKQNIAFQIVSSMQQAFEYHLKHATRGDIVLLSPGCASFGIFQNEFERGEMFREMVKKLS